MARRQRPRRGVAGGVTGADRGAVDLDAVSEVLARVRRAKTEAKRSQRAAVARLAVDARRRRPRPALEAARADLVDALTVAELDGRRRRRARRRRSSSADAIAPGSRPIDPR